MSEVFEIVFQDVRSGQSLIGREQIIVLDSVVFLHHILSTVASPQPKD
jgi:hypothetical protein